MKRSNNSKGLMAREMPDDAEESSQSEKDIDSDLLFNSALAFLGTPEGTQSLLQTVQGARDIGTAIGKMAAMVVVRIVKELESAQMSVTPEGIFDEDGGLTKVLVVIYTLANINGVQIPMEQSFQQAFEVAEADIQRALSQPQQPMQQQQQEPMTNGPVS
jgi:hypothetical protein